MERKYLFGIEDDGKTAGMISYFFVLGWSLAYFGFHQNNKTSLSSYHLRQTMFLYVSYLLIRFGLPFLFGANSIYFVVIVNVIFITLWVMGLNAASNAQKRSIPVLGSLAQSIFSFI